MGSLLPGTEVLARGLRWQVVFSLKAGDQELYRLRCVAGSFRGEELDLLEERGTTEFCRLYDPYHDVPLHDALPRPVLEIPGFEGLLDGVDLTLRDEDSGDEDEVGDDPDEGEDD